MTMVVVVVVGYGGEIGYCYSHSHNWSLNSSYCYKNSWWEEDGFDGGGVGDDDG